MRPRQARGGTNGLATSGEQYARMGCRTSRSAGSSHACNRGGWLLRTPRAAPCHLHRLISSLTPQRRSLPVQAPTSTRINTTGVARCASPNLPASPDGGWRIWYNGEAGASLRKRVRSWIARQRPNERRHGCPSLQCELSPKLPHHAQWPRQPLSDPWRCSNRAAQIQALSLRSSIEAGSPKVCPRSRRRPNTGAQRSESDHTSHYEPRFCAVADVGC